MNLSGATQKKINWQRIEDSAIGIVKRGKESEEAGAAGAAPPPIDVAPIFATARQEFQRALASLEFMTRMLVIVVGISVVASLAGVVLAAVWKQVLGGAAFTGAGTAALVALFLKIHAIGRDQAMLALVPTKYELALQFATSAQDRKAILARFLDEVSSLKRNAR